MNKTVPLLLTLLFLAACSNEIARPIDRDEMADEAAADGDEVKDEKDIKDETMGEGDDLVLPDEIVDEDRSDEDQSDLSDLSDQSDDAVDETIDYPDDAVVYPDLDWSYDAGEDIDFVIVPDDDIVPNMDCEANGGYCEWGAVCWNPDAHPDQAYTCETWYICCMPN